jgi:hypothetical protein
MGKGAKRVQYDAGDTHPQSIGGEESAPKPQSTQPQPQKQEQPKPTQTPPKPPAKPKQEPPKVDDVKPAEVAPVEPPVEAKQPSATQTKLKQPKTTSGHNWRKNLENKDKPLDVGTSNQLRGSPQDLAAMTDSDLADLAAHSRTYEIYKDSRLAQAADEMIKSGEWSQLFGVGGNPDKPVIDIHTAALARIALRSRGYDIDFDKIDTSKAGRVEDGGRNQGVTAPIKRIDAPVPPPPSVNKATPKFRKKDAADDFASKNPEWDRELIDGIHYFYPPGHKSQLDSLLRKNHDNQQDS